MSDLLALAEAEPEKPSRSKLEPHAEVIAVLRYKKKLSYQEIADWLEKYLKKTDPGFSVNQATVGDFLKGKEDRARKRPRQGTLLCTPGKEASTPPLAKTLAEGEHREGLAPASTPTSVPTRETDSGKARTVYQRKATRPPALPPEALLTNDQVEEA